MALNIVPKVTKGDCECCDSTAVDVTLQHGNMWMCATCSEKEKVATKLIEESKVIDSSIQVKADIYNAKTVAAIELRGAIEADSTIPADQKEYVYAKMCYDRYKHIQEVIFNQRKELIANENEMRMWQVNVQTTASKLRTEQREQFKTLDSSYQPVPQKTPKSRPIRTPKAVQREEIHEAARKYGIPQLHNAIKMMVQTRAGMSADGAARDLAQKLGLLKSTN